MLSESVKYLEETLTAGVIDRQSFDNYERRVHRAVMDLVSAAGAAQVDATHKQVSEWRKLMSDDEWRHLLALGIGPRQPRQANAATQCLSAILPGISNSPFPGESTRVFFLESLDINRDDKTFEKERGVLAALILDRRASIEFFNNPDRMSIDVMADVARDRIDELDLSPLH